MNRFAQILYDKAHWVFQSDETIDELRARFSPDCLFVDITAISPQPQEGWAYDGTNFTAPALYASLVDAQSAVLESLSIAAANAYVAGFTSSASGTAMWYDSDQDTQNVINRQFLIALSAPAIYSATQFFAGIPVGTTPVRAKASKTALDSTKSVNLLNAAQMVTLGNDLATGWAGVKAILWTLQAQVNAATTIAQVLAIAWPGA